MNNTTIDPEVFDPITQKNIGISFGVILVIVILIGLSLSILYYKKKLKRVSTIKQGSKAYTRVSKPETVGV
ncbi:hypothetical protein [Carp edema virus]|nr:hypothetical protein [Carp edema virus]